MSETLPKTLPGVVCSHMVRCGKLNCKCQRGELHGPYYYRFWREDGKLRKQYVPRSQLEAIRLCCSRRRLAQQETRLARQDASQFTERIRQVEKLISDSFNAEEN